MTENNINEMKDALTQLRNTLETASHLQGLMIAEYYEEELCPNVELLMNAHKGSEIVTNAVMDYLQKANMQVRSACALVGIGE